MEDQIAAANHTTRPETLGSRLEPVLSLLFRDDSPLFLSSNPQLRSTLSKLRFATAPFTADSLSCLPPSRRRSVLILLDTEDSLPPIPATHHYLANSRVLIIPLAAFDPSPRAALYSLSLLAESNVQQSTSLNRHSLHALATAPPVLQFRGPDTHLTCEPAEALAVMRPKLEPSIAPGEWVGIGAFFEVGLVQIADFSRAFSAGVTEPTEAASQQFADASQAPTKLSYSINGHVTALGTLFAHAMGTAPRLLPLVRPAQDLLRAPTSTPSPIPLRLEIRDSRVAHISQNGSDLTPHLAHILGVSPHNLLLTEFSVSTNAHPSSDSLDWSANAVMNESVLGLHLAVGDALTVPHIDFLSPGTWSQSLPNITQNEVIS